MGISRYPSLASIKSDIEIIKSDTTTLKSNTNAIKCTKPRAITNVMISTPTIGVWYQAFEITGAGKLTRLSTFGANCAHDIRIYVDGVVVDLSSISSSVGASRMLSTRGGSSPYAGDFIFDVHFNSSIRVDIKATLNENGVGVSADYNLI